MKNNEDSWDRVAEPYEACRPLDKKIKLFPGLTLFCNRGRNLLLIESNGMVGSIDLAQCENRQAIDGWIKDIELLIK
jgi:hypothetical protein